MSAALLMLAALVWSFERPVHIGGPGRAALVLDRDVYAEARLDLADLRLLDENGREVPYVLDRAGDEAVVRLQPEVLNRGFVRGRSESVTLDFGQRTRKCGIALSLAGENFRRRVVVEGSDQAQVWTTLVDQAWVFAVPGSPPARYERVGFPENDQRYVRVTVQHGPDDPERFEIVSAEAWGEARRPAAATVFTPRLSRFEDAERRESVLVLDLGARGQPFREVLVDAAAPAFFRAVSVEARRDPPPPKPGETGRSVQWSPLGDAAIYRYESGGRKYESLRVAVSGRERAIRLRIRNLDDRPLDVSRLSVIAPVERLLFEVETGRRYSLRYGAPAAGPPAYDLTRTAGDPADWGATAMPARFGPPLQLQSLAGRLPPWTERHPALLWVVLVAVVLALSAVTWRALQSAG